MIATFEEKKLFSHTILIIEDDKLCLYAAECLFSQWIANMDSAQTVKEALAKLASKRYDLVVSDIRLPDGSGKDIVAKIKATPESLNRQTPFIALTAHSDIATYRQIMAAGFLMMWVKPLTPEKVTLLLETYPAI